MITIGILMISLMTMTTTMMDFLDTEDALPYDPTEFRDIDGDGYGDSMDNDGDGYLNATEGMNNSDSLNQFSIPRYYFKHVQYPYNLHFRNMTIKIRE